MRAIVNCEENYVSRDGLCVPYLETSVIHDPEKREITVFAVNRSKTEDMELSLTLEGFENAAAIEHMELYHDDLKAVNTEENVCVFPEKRAISSITSKHQKINLKKHSWNMVRYTY